MNKAMFDRDKYKKTVPTQSLKALANEERFQILLLLHQKNQLCAQDIQKYFYLEQSTTSHHLKLLKDVGLIQATKKGRHIYYAFQKEVYEALMGQLQQLFDL